MTQTMMQLEAAEDCLAAAARVARKVGLGLSVQVVVPYQPDTVRYAQRIADEVEVEVKVVEIGARSIRVVFSSRHDGTAEPASACRTGVLRRG